MAHSYSVDPVGVPITTTLKMNYTHACIDHISLILVNVLRSLLVEKQAYSFNIDNHETINSIYSWCYYNLRDFYYKIFTPWSHEKQECFGSLLLPWSKLNYSILAFFLCRQSLAKCPASLQQKKMISDKSRGVLVVAFAPRVPGFLPEHMYLWWPNFIHL